MTRQVLFIQGGGDNGYQADEALVISLRSTLGEGYQVNYPEIKSDENAPDFGWLKQIGENVTTIDGKFILVGHSLGASMILKYLSENDITGNIKGIFLIATPFWSGNEEWQKGLKLKNNFADKLLNKTPIFLYHSKDDEEISFSHLNKYRQKIPAAFFRKIETGGHQLNNDLSLVAKDIKSL